MTFFSRRKIAPFWSKVKVQSLNIKPSAKKTPSTLTCGVTPAALPYGSDHITALKRLPPCRCPPKLVFRGELTLEQSSGAVRLTSEKPTSLKRHVIFNFIFPPTLETYLKTEISLILCKTNLCYTKQNFGKLY